MSQAKFLLIVTLVMVGEISASKLPEYIKVCKRDQNTINDCLRDSIKNIRSYLPKGIPEINVPSLDPFHFEELKPAKGALGDLDASFKNVQVVGLSDFEVKKLNLDLESMMINASLKMPVVSINGRYYIDLKILSFPIKGEGPFSANLTDVSVNAVLKYHVETRGGKDYMNYTSCDLAVHLEDYNINLEGLFEDTLGEAGKRLVQENKQELLRIVLPYLESTISDSIVLDAANGIASAASYDELLPAP